MSDELSRECDVRQISSSYYASVFPGSGAYQLLGLL
jgi:hypothetical protein